MMAETRVSIDSHSDDDCLHEGPWVFLSLKRALPPGNKGSASARCTSSAEQTSRWFSLLLTDAC